MEENNNAGVMTVEAVGGPARTGPASTGPAAPVAVPSPRPKPAVSQPDPSAEKVDLTIRAIRVNGRAPDGKGDCKIGKNDVAVLVKNTGEGDAGGFVVRLLVDGDLTDATVDGLGAGEERGVRFGDVQLQKGEHTLQAAADPEQALAESSDGNNELKLTARCNGA